MLSAGNLKNKLKVGEHDSLFCPVI